METKMTIKNYKNLDRNNKYFVHIEQCKNKNYPTGTQLHKHHIIPEHVLNNKAATTADLDYMDSTENLVSLSIEDHIVAHELLFELYKNDKDRGAVAILKGQLSEAAQIWKQQGAIASHEAQKDSNKQFWNQEFQKEMARRSMTREDALEIRSKGGRRGGKTTKMNVAIQPHHRYTFSYNKEEVVSIINCSSGTQVLQVLNQIEKTPLARVTQLLKGEKKSLHGWSCKRLEDGPILAEKYLSTLQRQAYDS